MSILGRMMAAVNAWTAYGKEAPITSEMESRYHELWSWAIGEWAYDARIKAQQIWAPDIYTATRQVWRHTSAIVDFYDQFVYEGDLSQDGSPLSDGTRGAIPIDPYTGSEQTDAQLVTAIHQLFDMWRFQSKMSMTPMLCAVLGDCLTEIVDDYQHGMVDLRTIWPGSVPDCDLELDDRGNVKRYALEYPITIEASTAFGKTVQAERYLYRKEVDSEAFRYYKDGQPWTDNRPSGHGQAVQPNPYGFAPAVWERHKEVPWSNRGISAIARTYQQTLQINSTLSHAIDYQNKQFAIPVGVIGSAIASSRGGRVVTLPGGISVTFPNDRDPTLDEIAEARRQASEQQHVISMSADGKFVTADFNVGSTTEMINLVMESVLAESPEARYGQEILQMSQVTGPGMERLLASIVGRIRAARKMHDPQTENKLRMATTIMGYRVNGGFIPAEIMRNRPVRFAAFKPFDLMSYGKGLENFSIPGRAVFPETPLERAQRTVLVQQVTDPDLMLQLGRDPEMVAQLTAERQQQAEREAALLTGFGPPAPQPQQSEEQAA